MTRSTPRTEFGDGVECHPQEAEGRHSVGARF